MMAVGYEWDVETVTDDEYEDVVDHDFRDTYAECLKIASSTPPEENCFYRIVLVRDAECAGGYWGVGRSWAYMDDGKLPTHFEDAYNKPVAKVPQKFVKEVERASKETA